MAKKSTNSKPSGNPPSTASAHISKKSKPKKKKSDKRQSSFVNAPIYDLLHNFERAPDQWAARYILILSGVILRSAVGLGSFLGESQPPINGDFEAQRHWMELTFHLPITSWYFYDLQYWGLDYPPLTAFHLYVCGKIGSFINSSWFALDVSRGIETSGLKTYMRFTSLLSEVLIYFPALLGFIAFLGKKLNLSRMDQIVLSAIIMCQPSLILIDHGHFQYNSIMLGLFLFSLTDLCAGNYVLASVWFVLCINFKQMGLYYAPFIFAYLLSKTFTNVHDTKQWSFIKCFNLNRLLAIGFTVIITFATILFPFALAGYLSEGEEVIDQLKQILIRVFPFQRGIFEDKVANFWCTTNLVIKYRNIFTLPQLTKISLLLTILSILPPCSMIFYKNVFSKKFLNLYWQVEKYLALVYGFAATSWGFYLFSFQVHEKTVLVPLLPSTLLYLLGDLNSIAMCQWINNIAVFSMWPLLKKDGLILQYIVVLFLSNFLIGGFSLGSRNTLFPPRNILWKLVIICSYVGAFIIHFIDYFYLPPVKYPDLWVILNTTLSFGCFGLFWLWLLYRMYKL